MGNLERLAAIPDDELEALLERLTAHAVLRVRSLFWRGSRSGVLPAGESPKTIVQGAFKKLVEGAKWSEGKDAATVLRGIVDSQISNLVRSWENKNLRELPLPAEGTESTFVMIPDEGLNPLELIVRSEDDEIALGKR